MRIKLNSGYSKEIASKYVNLEDDFLVVSNDVVPVYRFDNDLNKYTDEVVSYKIQVVQMGSESFYVKFNKKVKVKQLSNIKILELEACEVKNNVYFRAVDVKGV